MKLTKSMLKKLIKEEVEKAAAKFVNPAFGVSGNEAETKKGLGDGPEEDVAFEILEATTGLGTDEEKLEQIGQKLKSQDANFIIKVVKHFNKNSKEGNILEVLRDELDDELKSSTLFKVLTAALKQRKGLN